MTAGYPISGFRSLSRRVLCQHECRIKYPLEIGLLLLVRVEFGDVGRVLRHQQLRVAGVQCRPLKHEEKSIEPQMDADGRG